jgi:hypothetical protein
LGVSQNNIGNGGKHIKKGVKIRTLKQSYEVLVYKEKHVKVVTRPTHHYIIILMLFLFALILC